MKSWIADLTKIWEFWANRQTDLVDDGSVPRGCNVRVIGKELKPGSVQRDEPSNWRKENDWPRRFFLPVDL